MTCASKRHQPVPTKHAIVIQRNRRKKERSTSARIILSVGEVWRSDWVSPAEIELAQRLEGDQGNATNCFEHWRKIAELDCIVSRSSHSLEVIDVRHPENNHPRICEVSSSKGNTKDQHFASGLFWLRRFCRLDESITTVKQMSG